jgi:L-ascorbate metabolism protein UlaG (beta-lactamase superfamily)
MSVNLEWIGLACFRLWQNGGPVIAMDPYSPSVVSKACGVDQAVFDIRIQADTIIVSSLTDQAHCYVKLVEGNPKVIDALSVAQGHSEALISDEPLVAVQAAESPDHPDGARDNALYSFKVGGLWFLHMGDLGFGIDTEQIAPFAGHCDVLLALTGEDLTLGLDELDPMIDALKPTWIVPMHYDLPPMGTSGMTKVDVFLNRRPRDPIIYARHHTVTFPAPVLAPGRPTIVVLEPSGYQPTVVLESSCRPR